MRLTHHGWQTVSCIVSCGVSTLFGLHSWMFIFSSAHVVLTPCHWTYWDLGKHAWILWDPDVCAPGYSLKKPVELPKYCQVRVGSFWKLSTKTSFRASDMYAPFRISGSTEREWKKILIFYWQYNTDVLYSMCKGMQAVRVCLGFCTSVVDICRDLYVTLLCVDWNFIEVFIFFQQEFTSQRQWIPILIHRVDQHGVIVFKLDIK